MGSLLRLRHAGRARLSLHEVLARRDGSGLAIAPTIEVIDLGRIYEHKLDFVQRVARDLSIELRFTIEWKPNPEQRAILDELRAMPHVRILSYGEL